jgi:hypothetical protein
VNSDIDGMRRIILFISFWMSVTAAFASDFTPVRLHSLKTIQVSQKNWIQTPANKWGLHDLVFLSTKSPQKTLVITQKITTETLTGYCKSNKGVLQNGVCLTSPADHQFMAVQIRKVDPTRKGAREPSFYTAYYVKAPWTRTEATKKLDRLANQGIWE